MILDSVGGDVFDASMRAIAVDGRLLVIGFVSGRIPQVAGNRILFKGISVVGVPYGGFTARNPEAWARNMDTLLDLAARGVLRPQIDGAYPLAEAGAALARLAARATVGKLVIYTEAGRARAIELGSRRP